MGILQPLVRAVVKSVNAWVGFVMTVIGAVGFVFPEWTPSINWNTVQVSMPRWGWLILALLGFVLLVITIIQEYSKALKQAGEKQVSPSSSTSFQATNSPGIFGSTIKDSNVYINPSIQASDREQDKPRLVRLNFNPRINAEWISIDITHSESKAITCYALIDSIELNGAINNELRQRIVEHSSRISWSGGSRDGEKTIDVGSPGTLNVATISSGQLSFEMQSGKRDTGLDWGVGTYKVNLSLYGKVGQEDFERRSFSVSFRCWHEENVYKSDLPNLDNETIRCSTEFVYNGNTSDYLYLQLIRGNSPENNTRVRKNPPTNWDNVSVESYNKLLGDSNIRGGVVINNTGTQTIRECNAKIVEIYDQKDNSGLYVQRQSDLPRTAGWEIDGVVIYDNQTINGGSKKYLALVQKKGWTRWRGMTSVFFYIGGKNNFRHDLKRDEAYFVELEIYGTIGAYILPVLRKFIPIHYDGTKATIGDALDSLPTPN